MISFGQLSSLMDEGIAILQAIPEGSRGSLESILPVLENVNIALNYNSSIIMGGLINVISQSGFDPFGLVSVSINGTDKYTLPMIIDELHDAAFDDIVELIKTILNGGNEASGVKEANLYSLSFNL